MLLFGLSTIFVHTCHFFFHSIYMEGAECNGIYMIKMLLRANLAMLYNEYQITCTSFSIDCTNINHSKFFWYHSCGYKM